jgi:two-component system, NarL family, sensor kinase
MGVGVFCPDKADDPRTLRVIAINPAAAEILAIKAEDVLGKTFADFPRFLETGFSERYLEVSRTRKAKNLGEITYGDEIIRQGTYSITAFPMPGDCVAIVFEDVGERKRAEEALRDSEQRYRSWFENNPVPMWVYDSEAYAFLAVNKAAIHHYGYSTEEFLAMSIKDIRPPEDIGRLIEVAQADRDVTKVGRWRHRKKDGTLIEVEVYSQLGMWQGKPAKLVQVRDITELHHVQAELEERSAYLNGLFKNSPVAIVALDSEGRVKMCNPAFERLFRFTESEIIGSVACEGIIPAALSQEAVALSERVRAGETVHLVTRRQRKDGVAVDVEVFGVPLAANGGQLGMYWIYQDITERKQAEAARRALSGRLLQLQDEERRRMARELHDAVGQNLTALSTNLGVVSNSAELLVGEKAKTALQYALQLAEQTSREVRTISYLLHPPMLDEEGLAFALDLYLDGFAQRSGIRVDLSIAPEIGRLSRELETTLFRIIQESLTNIHRHSGSETAAVQMYRYPGELVLEIRDTGRGMAPEILERTQRGASIGVGIAGMRERLRQLGGELQIESSAQGTTIRAVLPLSNRAI